jgi:hypothetical protein
VDPSQTPPDGPYFDIIRRMTPAQRLRKAFELSELTRALLRAGLRASHPQASPDDLHRMYLERLAACHNKNY